MRGDYYRAGPPWKAIFRDKKGFINQEVFKETVAPEEYFFIHIDEFKGPKKIVFKKCGELGNIVIYKEL